jgi:hypothetical protein
MFEPRRRTRVNENQPPRGEPDREPDPVDDAEVTTPVRTPEPEHPTGGPDERPTTGPYPRPTPGAPPSISGAINWRDWRILVPAAVVAGGLVLGGGIGGFIIGHVTADRDGVSIMRTGGGPFGDDHPRGPFGPDGPGPRGPLDNGPDGDGPDGDGPFGT